MYNKLMAEKKRPGWWKRILYALLIAIAGFILLNITFILYALFFNLFRLFLPNELPVEYRWLLILRHLLFMVIIGLISWPVLLSRIKPIFKAIYLMVPLATVFVTTGILLYEWPVLAYIISILIISGLLLYLWCTHRPWFYHYAVILVATGLLVFNLMGGEI
jgi:hypothetical protein